MPYCQQTIMPYGRGVIPQSGESYTCKSNYVSLAYEARRSVPPCRVNYLSMTYLGAQPVAREPHVALILKYVAPEIF